MVSVSITFEAEDPGREPGGEKPLQPNAGLVAKLDRFSDRMGAWRFG